MRHMRPRIALGCAQGPAYQPINRFLREVAQVTDEYREYLATHPDITFTATVRHLCWAIRKLAAHMPRSEATRVLYRGVRGELDPNFWRITDRLGMVCAVDMAFMSTSKNRATPISYMATGKHVLWRLHAGGDTDTAYHCGADISEFSQVHCGWQEHDAPIHTPSP